MRAEGGGDGGGGRRNRPLRKWCAPTFADGLCWLVTAGGEALYCCLAAGLAACGDGPPHRSRMQLDGGVDGWMWMDAAGSGDGNQKRRRGGEPWITGWERGCRLAAWRRQSGHSYKYEGCWPLQLGHAR